MIWLGLVAAFVAGFWWGWRSAFAELRSARDYEAKGLVLAWAESGGFAAVHGAGASSDAIADDFLKYARRCGWKLVRL